MREKIRHFFESHPYLDELRIDVLTIVARPIMILLKIPADILTRMYETIPGYISAIFDALGKCIILPFNILIGIAAHFSKNEIRQKTKIKIGEWVHNRIDFFRDKFLGRNVARQIKLFYEIVSSQMTIESSFARGYYFTKIFYILALLPQCVSFLTTLSGASVFFQGIADVAPLFIAIVIQASLYILSTRAFEYNAKAHLKVLLSIMMVCSIATSYTGLIIMNHSPEREYKSVYNEYKNQFEKVKIDAENSDIALSPAQVADKLVNVFKQLETNQKQLQAGIEQAQINLDAEDKPRSSITLNEEVFYNDNYIQETNRQNDMAQELAQERQAVEIIIGIINKWKNEWKDTQDKDTQDKGTQTSLADALSTWVQSEMDSKQDNENEKIKEFWNDVQLAIKQNNGISKGTSLKGIEKIKLANQNTYLKKMITFSNIESIILDEYDKIINSKNGSAGKGKNKNAGSKVWNLMENIGRLFGYELDSNMRNIEEQRTALQDAIDNNYAEIAVYLDISLLKDLEESKNKADAIPGSFVYSIALFGSGNTRGDAFLNLFFAMITDIITLLLSFAGAKKHASFLYVRSSKDYYTDINELFAMIFKSMQSNELLRINQGKFLGVSNVSFREHCMEYVNSINIYIVDFLRKFELSESTITEGYALCWKYRMHEEIKTYQPIITALLKANLLKVLPLASYEKLEYEYHLGMEFAAIDEDIIEKNKVMQYQSELEADKQKGYVLLLKSKGENYLRENISDRYAITSEGGNKACS